MFALIARRCLPILAAVCLLLLGSASAAPKGKTPPRPKRTVARLDEMLEWLSREQQPKNGGYTWRNHVGFAAGPVQFRDPNVGPPDVTDTAMVALAMLRTDNTPDRGPRKAVVRDAADFVAKAVEASDPYALELTPLRTPLTARIGHHADTFFALWLLAELRAPQSPAGIDPLVSKLIEKIERNIKPDGSWGDDDKPALNSPLLGHAVGVRALETASRKGFKVNPEVLAAAGAYALTDKALKLDAAQSGKWKKRDSGGLRPTWQFNSTVDDLEPINEAFYVSAARLSVLDQADRSNAVQEKRIHQRLRQPASNAELQQLAASLKSIAATRQTLARARGQMYAAFGEKKSFAPVIYCADDFLAALLTVDAMGIAMVEQWFPPTVRALMIYQDVDGGLKYQEHIACEITGARCHNRAWGPCLCQTPCMTALGMPSELCPSQRSFCARDRVFCTAAGMAILVADTPYRQGFLDPKTVK